MKDLKIILGFALVALAVFFMCGFYVGDGCKHCPKCPEVRDSVSQGKERIVYVDSSKIKIRDSIQIKHVTVYDTAGNKVPVVVETKDTGKVADIADTTMSDGAKIGITLRAKLIIPPVSAAIRYTPAPDSGQTWTFYDTTTVYKTSWTGITIGTLGGFIVGGSVVGIFAYLISKE
jgi:hypothetical protein